MPHMANTEQAQAWNGPEGDHWARHQDRWNAVNEGFDAPLADAAEIAGDCRTLDLGCGSGQTTRLAARRAPRGHALGLDLSGPMLAAARARAAAEGLTNIAFVQGDAQVHPLEEGAFDAAISRYGVMFYADPVAAFSHVRRALRPGGRLAFVCPAGAGLNEWVAAVASLRAHADVGAFGRPGLPGMFSLAEPDRIREILTAAGFTALSVRRAEAYGVWGDGAEGAAGFLLGSGPGRHLLQQAAAPARSAARRTLTEHLRRHEAADGTV
ncbi:methyltransferase domain-containing protein, partial [Streptomyces sp. SID5785]|uniref:methyltransferase domain-containing protein n=1 Tax=Streptomyces sp. SID5785 TaxID=2690309 RepID=UPI001361A43E|nr:methyltransferase domain-containing protein [Streptomyces sp. SID5785]